MRDGNGIDAVFHYLVGIATGVEHFTEAHEMGLFTHEEHCAAFASAGMDVTFDEEGLMGPRPLRRNLGCLLTRRPRLWHTRVMPGLVPGIRREGCSRTQDAVWSLMGSRLP